MNESRITFAKDLMKDHDGMVVTLKYSPDFKIHLR